MSCRSNSRGLARFGERSLEPLHMVSPSRPAPPPPTPSFRRQPARDENRPSSRNEARDNERASDPATKIWARIRRASGLSLAHPRRNTSSSTTASVTASVSAPFSSACGTDGRALRRKKPGLTGCGGPTVERQRLAATGSKQSLTDRTNQSMVEDCNDRRSPRGSGKGRRTSGRWAFGNWWLNG